MYFVVIGLPFILKRVLLFDAAKRHDMTCYDFTISLFILNESQGWDDKMCG